MNPVLAGLAAGCIATAPMTLFMALAFQALPAGEKYPLPPREITIDLADKAGVDEALGETSRRGLTFVAHFGYGAAMGALYGWVTPVVPGPELAKGVVFGLLVWAASYLVVLPALGILAPATWHPVRRTALMIAAHVVWGAFLAWMVARFTA